MRRAVLSDVRRFQIETVPVPPPEPGHVRLKVLAAGICGSDLHTYLGENPVLRTPIAPGHEFAGTVDAVGDGADPSLLGALVAARPSVSCGRCPECATGREHLCDAMKFVGSLSYDGAFAEYVVLPAACVVPMDGGLEPAEIAFTEPTAVAVHAVGLPGAVAGHDILVVGCGTVGLLIAQVLILNGARVHVTDLVDEKIALAESFGAQRATFPADGAGARAQAGDAAAFEAVFDCVGHNSTLALALRSVRKGGTVVLVGVPVEPIVLDPVDVLLGERRLVGSYIYTNEDFTEAVRLLLDRLVTVQPLITSRLLLEEIGAAFELAVTGNERVKLIIEP